MLTDIALSHWVDLDRSECFMPFLTLPSLYLYANSIRGGVTLPNNFYFGILFSFSVKGALLPAMRDNYMTQHRVFSPSVDLCFLLFITPWFSSCVRAVCEDV
jgi:hypothetical protein